MVLCLLETLTVNNNNGQTDYIQQSIIKLRQWLKIPRQARMAAESILLGDLNAAKKRGYKVGWCCKGALYIPFVSYKIK